MGAGDAVPECRGQLFGRRRQRRSSVEEATHTSPGQGYTASGQAPYSFRAGHTHHQSRPHTPSEQAIQRIRAGHTEHHKRPHTHISGKPHN